MQPSILMLGAGSIGKRHLKNLLSLGHSADQITVVEPRDDRKNELTALGIAPARIFPNRDSALKDRSYDGAIVATPTSFHIQDAIVLAKKDIHLMIEKPLGVDLKGYEQLQAEIKKRKLFAFVAYCYRFHPAPQKIRALIKEGLIGKPLYARGEMCSFLPAWHPYEDYRHFYMAIKKLGGGTLLDQSHIFDLTRMFFGDVKGLYALSMRHSDLEIETDDFGEILVEMKSGTRASLHIDLFSQPRREYYHIMGSKGTLQWDIPGNKVTHLVQEGFKEEFDFGKDKNLMYVEELRYFLRGIEADGPIEGPNLLDGKGAMDMIVNVRKSKGMKYVRI